MLGELSRRWEATPKGKLSPHARGWRVIVSRLRTVAGIVLLQMVVCPIRTAPLGMIRNSPCTRPTKRTHGSLWVSGSNILSAHS
jgi:hypothetical protein